MNNIFDDNTPPFATIEIDGIPVAVFAVNFCEKKKMFNNQLKIDKIDYNYLSDKRPESKEVFEKHLCNCIVQILNEQHMGDDGKYNIQ